VALGEALLELQQLTERLRRDCPWDREQTARTIVPHTVEEAYEVADAAQGGDREKLLDELGDLLFQVYFLALLLQEEGAGDLEAVARTVHEKLVRRHPHVFGEAEAGTPGRVRENWERIKREQEEREGVFHHVSESLPSLLYAQKVQRRARAVGFEYPDVDGALADLDDELRELKEAVDEAGGEPAPESEPDPHIFEELGDVLFAAVNVARRVNVDPELALRAMSDRFVARVERAERLADEEGKRWTGRTGTSTEPRRRAYECDRHSPRAAGARLPREPNRRGRGHAGVRRLGARGRSFGRVDRRARGARAA
jgi:nucleoside triphosphate diphosphatase